MRYLTFTLAALFILGACSGPKKEAKGPIITAPITDYIPTSTPSQINIMGYFVSPEFYGDIKPDGTLTLELPVDFNAVSKKAFKEYNKYGDNPYQLSSQAVTDLFVGSDNLITTGKDATISLAGKSYGFEVYQDSSNVTGYAFPTSTIDFLYHIKQPDTYPAEKGYVYGLLFSDKDINISGVKTDTIYLNEDIDQPAAVNTTYDLTCIKGWNVYKYSIKETLKNEAGFTFPKETLIEKATFEELNQSWKYLGF